MQLLLLRLKYDLFTYIVHNDSFRLSDLFDCNHSRAFASTNDATSTSQRSQGR